MVLVNFPTTQCLDKNYLWMRTGLPQACFLFFIFLFPFPPLYFNSWFWTHSALYSISFVMIFLTIVIRMGKNFFLVNPWRVRHNLDSAADNRFLKLCSNSMIVFFLCALASIQRVGNHKWVWIAYGEGVSHWDTVMKGKVKLFKS